MKTYFTALLFTSVAGGIATVLAGKPYEKHLRFLAALVCTAVIAAPLLQLAPDIRLDLSLPDESEAPDYGLVERQAEEDGETALYNYIFSQTGVKPKEISIEIEREGEQLYLRSVRVKTEAAETERVKKCLDSLFAPDLEAEVYQ